MRRPSPEQQQADRDDDDDDDDAEAVAAASEDDGPEWAYFGKMNGHEQTDEEVKDGCRYDRRTAAKGISLTGEEISVFFFATFRDCWMLRGHGDAQQFVRLFFFFLNKKFFFFLNSWQH